MFIRLKTLLPIIVIGLVLAFAFHFNAIAYLDAPHNESYHVWCGRCHGQEGILESGYSGGSVSYDGLCTNICHTEPSCPYTELNAPNMKAHSDSDDNKLADCCTCHDPHYQKQKNYNLSDPDNFYIAKGKITAFTYNSVVHMSFLNYSDINYKSGWDATKLTGKTEECRRTILFPDKSKLGFSYPIIAITEDTPTEGTITVKGKVNEETVYMYKDPPTDFVVLYGQYIKDQIKACSITTNQGCNKPEDCPVGEECILIGDVKFFGPEGTNSFADGNSVYNGICEVCHTQPDPPHLVKTRCTNCHTHSEGLKKVPASGCIGCHYFSFNGRAAITQQFSANSHHVQGVTLDNTHCYECHWEANVDGTINNSYHEGYNTDTESSVSGEKVDLVIYNDGARPTEYNAVTAIQYMANGNRIEIGKLNAHCLSCHNNENNETVPFGDGKTPSQYAWDNVSINVKYSNLGTTTWGKYNGVYKVAEKNITKAYSAHGRAILNGGGWSSTSGVDGWPTNTRAGFTNIACFDCHNSHGSTVSGTTTSYTSATANGGILKDTQAGKGGYTMTYKPHYGGSPGDKNEYNAGAGLCFDCHLTASPGDKPWGYNSTFGATQEIMGYRDTPYFGPSTSGAQQRFALKTFASHQGGHFGASSALEGLPGNPPPDKATINGLCTPCHDPHGISPTINHEYAVPLLKGTWLTSPYQEDISPWYNGAGIIRTDKGREGVRYHIDQNTFGSGLTDDTFTGIQEESYDEFAGLCKKCHAKESLTDGINGGTWKSIDRIHESVKDWGANSKHNYPCSKCHAPHSARLPRLMITNCLDSNHKSRYGYQEPPPVLSGSGSGDFDGCQYGECYGLGFPGKHTAAHEYKWYSGNGYGNFPGSFHSDWLTRPIIGQESQLVSCHENKASDQSWNEKTMWSDDRLFIYSGPEAGSFTADCSDIISAIITWTTINKGTSYVDYGFTDSYEDPDSPQGNDTMVRTHSITLTGLENHKTYHYRVRSTGELGSEIISEDHTFYISLPPTLPRLTREPDVECSSSCAVNLQWEASTDPDNGPIEYYVEVDDAIDFTSPDYNSDWIADTEWEPTLPTDNTWYWRVKARDANHTEAVSEWSGVDYFYVNQSLPAAPLIEESFETTKICENNGYELSWIEAGGSGCTSYNFDEDSAIPDIAPLNAGSQCLKIIGTGSCAASASLDYGSVVVGKTYTAFYVYIASANVPYDDVGLYSIARMSDGNNTTVFELRLLKSIIDGKLKFRLFVNIGANEYSDYPEISLNTWYRIRLYYDASDGWAWMVDDTLIQSGGFLGAHPDGIQHWLLGMTYATGSATVYYDRLTVYNVQPPWNLETPVLIDEPNNETIDTDVELEWYEVTYPDNPVQYYVQIDDSSNFNSPEYGSGWLSETDAFCDGTKCSWTQTIILGKTWYWRVLARDSYQTNITSLWSTGDDFIIEPTPPDPPTLIGKADISSTLDMVTVELEWNPVACPDGDPVEYNVEVDNDPDFTSPIYSSGWISETKWIVSLPAGNTWHWRAQAKDAVHTEAVSDWSVYNSFNINSLVPIIEESFEGAGYEEFWKENLGDGCSIDPDSVIPGTAPSDAGSECLKLISDTPDYQSAVSLDYITEITKTFTRMYLYVEAEGLENGQSKYIGAFEDSADNDVFRFRLTQSVDKLYFNLMIYNGGDFEYYYVEIPPPIARWHRIDIKYDNTDNKWEWKFDGEPQNNGDGLLKEPEGSDGHYTGIQKWNLGFPSTGDITGTIYFDLFAVDTTTYPD